MPLGLHEIVHGIPPLEEPGIGNDVEIERLAPLFEHRLDRFTHQIGRTNRHCRFVDHDTVIIHVASDTFGDAEHLAQVSRSILVGRCADGDELVEAEIDPLCCLFTTG